jgi:serine/threonine protein kinase
MTDKHTVWDKQGAAYKLTGKIGEGGQGTVCKTQMPNVLVKVSNFAKDDSRTLGWYKQLQSVMRQPLKDLHIAQPRALIVKPRLGYVMELMDGLEPLQALVEEAHLSMIDGKGLVGFVASGGLRRRLTILSNAARLLAKLHGRALAYGDLSPSNIFVSQTKDRGEVWLIDCDNLAVLSREGGQKLYTPEYGAPEILQGISGINSLTDSWSFAVIAFQLLTLLHPLKGDLVTEGEEDLGNAALRGLLPWIDHPEDRRNASTHGLPRDDVLTDRLRQLFGRCFGQGLADPEFRPSMTEWAEAFEEALAITVSCKDEEGCGNTFLFNRERKCPFCDSVQAESLCIRLRHYLFISPKDFGMDTCPKDRVLSTGHIQVIEREAMLELRSSPVGTSTYLESPIVCRLRLTAGNLWIEALNDEVITFVSKSGTTLKIRKKESVKAQASDSLLHIGDIEKTHSVWRFWW